MSKTHKKFYNINRWEQRFFMNLSPVQKLAWEYVNDKSDNIGVWEPNLKVLTFHIGAELNVDNFFKTVNSNKERLIKLPDGNWFIPDYVKFQYCQSNPLNPCNRAHRSYLKDMDARGLLDWFIGNYPDVLKTAVRYKSELDAKDLDKIPKPFQSFLDTLIKGSNRGLKELNESRIEKDKEKASDTEEEQATDKEQEPTPNSSVQPKKKMNGKPTLNNGYYSELKSHINDLALTNTGSLTFQRDVDSLIEEFKTDQVKDPEAYLMREAKRVDWLKFSWPDFVRGIKQQSEIPF